MSRVLGAEDYDFVVIDHPISSASEADLQAQARNMVARASELLLLPANDS